MKKQKLKNFESFNFDLISFKIKQIKLVQTAYFCVNQ